MNSKQVTVDNGSGLINEAMSEHIKKMVWTEEQIRLLLVDDSIEPVEAFKRLDAIYNTVEIYSPDDWELCVTSVICDVAERCEAIESYLASDFHDKHGD